MLTRKLAETVIDVPTGSIADEFLAKAEDGLIDTIGVMLAGSREDVALIAQRWSTDFPSTPTASVLGTSLATSPADAAFANGIAAHALDFDDSSPGMRGHPSSAIVPVILAVGEATEASGRDVLESYLLALEIAGKLGRVIGPQHYSRGWHNSSTIGAFSATAAAARLWHLSVEELQTAWGIAASMSSGLVRNFGTMTKPFHLGHTARVGITAAWMAKNGLTADTEILEGDGGYTGLYGFGDGETLEKNVGTPGLLEHSDIFVKGWPCCYCNHRPIGGMLKLIAEHGIKPDDVEEIAIGFVPGSDLGLIRDNPQTGLEGKFSIQYAMAALALDGTLTLDSFTDAAVQRPAVRALMKRVRRYRIDAEGYFTGTIGYTDVTVKTKRGTHHLRVDRVPGSPDWPLSEQDREIKFLDCAGRAIGPQGARALLDLTRRTRELPRIAELTAAATPHGRVAELKRA